MRGLLSLLAIVQLVAATSNGCNADNCLRAVRNTGAAPRGATDCSSYFRVTVTPSTQTVHSTVHTTLTPSPVSITISDTLTITLPTATSIISVVVTSTPPEVTSSVTDTVTTTVTANAAKRALELHDRQVTTSPSGIPTYASACSGAVRYSSACSCIGAIRSTTTVSAPVTTTTTTVTVTATASTVLVTKSETTTLPTQTTLVTSASTLTLSASTTTVTDTATSTSSSSVPTQTYIPCTGPPFNEGGTGGCSSSCFCDQLAGSSAIGFCDNANSCGRSCSTTADCPSGQACTSGHPECNGGNVCLDYTGCSASGSKMMLARDEELWRMMREGPVEKREIELLRGVNTQGKPSGS